MANYNDLITAIDSVIKTNNRREITGQLLQNILNTMVGSLGENYQLAGFATPTTNPHQPDQNVFYVASQAGVYTQFDNIVLGDGISFLMWKNGAWTSQTISLVTQSWVQQNFVSKEWFRKVFRVYDEDGLEIVPNDMDSVVDNIKAMVGLWTNEYLSALGMGRDGGGTTQTLAQLNDVQLGTLANGDALVYNSAIHKWENKQIQAGVDMSVVWAALAANTNEQINASHLTTALSGYVTTAALGTTLQNYATQSWVNQNYATQSWVNQNFITVEWFDKLFQLYNGTEAEANKITPNGALPVDQAQLNIEAMFGFWTKKYISALGKGDDGTTSYNTLAQLNDVILTNPTANQILVYDGTHWRNQNQQSVYELPVATTTTLGGIMLGYAASGKNYAIQLDANGKAYVNVPWSDTTYTLPTASADTLGGVKVGTTLAISSGVLNLPTTGVTAGTYKRVTVDAYGRVTSGDNTDTDTWRGVYVDGVSKVGTGVNTKAINFKAGSNVSLSFAAAGTGSGQSGNANYFDVVISATDTTYSANNGVGLSGTTFYNSGVRATTINGNYLRINTNGTNADLTIPYATNANTSSYSTYATYLNATYNNGGTTWTWNPLNQTQYYTWGQQFKNANVSTDTADMRLYIAANNTSAGGLGLWLNIDGGINAMTSLYAGEYVQVGNIKLVYDSTNNAIKVVKSDGTAANFYATGGVSALGAGQESGGGGGDVTWALLASQATGGRSIHSSYITSALSNYLPLSGGSISGKINIFPNNAIGNYDEGLRIHAYNGYSVLCLCSYDNTGNYGTTTNTWGIINHNGEFYINKNGSYHAKSTLLANVYDRWVFGGNSLLKANAEVTIYNDVYPNLLLKNTGNDECSIYFENKNNANKWAIGQGIWGNIIGNGFGIGDYGTTLQLCFYINTNGTCVATHGFSNQSDIRFKTKISDIDLSVEQIAKMPTILYRWKDREDARIYAGSVAQNWESVLPQVVDVGTDPRQFRSLQYGVAALISAITIARKVMTHEEKIALLETRVSALEKENGEQEQLINSLQEELAKFKAA